jgi:hypothetical protein
MAGLPSGDTPDTHSRTTLEDWTAAWQLSSPEAHVGGDSTADALYDIGVVSEDTKAEMFWGWLRMNPGKLRGRWRSAEKATGLDLYAA